jgi:hypothetical protein
LAVPCGKAGWQAYTDQQLAVRLLRGRDAFSKADDATTTSSQIAHWLAHNGKIESRIFEIVKMVLIPSEGGKL